MRAMRGKKETAGIPAIVIGHASEDESALCDAYLCPGRWTLGQ